MSVLMNTDGHEERQSELEHRIEAAWNNTTTEVHVGTAASESCMLPHPEHDDCQRHSAIVSSIVSEPPESFPLAPQAIVSITS